MHTFIKSLAFEFIGALLGSVVGVLFTVGIFWLIYILKLDMNFFGGDKAMVFFLILFGMPLGSLICILLVNNIYFGFKGYNILGIITGLVLCIFGGGILNIWLLDKIGTIAVALIPLVIIFISILGYHIPLRIRKRKGKRGIKRGHPLAKLSTENAVIPPAKPPLLHKISVLPFIIIEQNMQ